MSRLTRHLSPLSALLFAALAAAPLFSNSGFLFTHGEGESAFLLVRLQQLIEALRAGQFPARWMPDAALGYGYPFFNYYASFPYYLAALLKAYGFSFVLALKLTQLAGLLVAAGGVYGWVRSLTGSPAQAWLASAAYTFAPFHLVNLYLRGDSLSELWAMALYPLTLWSAQRCLQRPGFRQAFALAASVALLILTHNISALNFMPFLALYLALAGWVTGSRWRFASGVLALAWGLLLSAFFWLPALREIRHVQIGGLTEGFFFYGNHFRSRDLIQPTLFFNFEAGANRPTPFSMGLVQALVAGAGLGVMVGRWIRARRVTWFDVFTCLGFALSTFMITPLSAWFWAHLPLVHFAQFPWRFLSIQSLFVALLISRLAPGQSPI
ncbi:MAG: 6-pyruvoyl-tetrahydropterin synthase-related protein, partial [Anaerolineales bacterium]